MTVAAFSTSTSYPLFGTNIGPFGTVWPYEKQADVQVWLTLPPAAARLLTKGPDYALADVTSIVDGGLITLDGSLPGRRLGAGALLTVRRNTSNDQPSGFGEALGFSPQASEAALDHVERQLQDIRTSLALVGAGGGGGGGGASDWSQLTNIPAVWPGQVSWASITGRPGAWPGTLPFGSLTSVPSTWPGDLPYGSLTGLPALINAIDGLVPANGKIIEFTGAGTAHLINTPAGGGGGGSMEPQELSAFGAVDATGANPATNDPTIAAAELAADSAVYLRDGMFAKSAVVPAFSNLTKAYRGRGRWKEGTAILPATFAYMTAKPTTPATQGLTGWWDGDNRFNDGGEYKIIGAAVRSFDIAGPARYFEENTIPHPVWMDVLGGNSGANAFLTLGAAAGVTRIALAQAADASWVGKTVAFADSYGGGVLETRVVTAVNTGGNNFDVGVALANTYVWNPLGGHAPNIYFHLRTSASWHYSKFTHAGGGDAYNVILRQNVNYAPKATEMFHPFMTATGGNLGGDTYINSDGVFAENQEWQIQHQGFDASAIGYVSSHTRAKDDRLGGTFCLGTLFKFDGGRPYDAAHSIQGTVRNAIDTAFATLYETSLLTANAPAGTSTFNVKSTNGAHPNDPVVLGSETLTINTVVSATQFTTTAACVGNYVTGNLVSYTKGGAVLNMAKGQRLVWNSSVSQTARGGDPNNVFSAGYGNVQGDVIMTMDTDSGGGDFWSVRFARGTTSATPDTARIRLKPSGMNLFGTAHTVAGDLSLTNTSNFNLDLSGAARMSLGPSILIRVNGGHLQGTLDGGATWTNIL